MKPSRQENLIYLVVWGLLFAAPLLTLYARSVGDADLSFDWYHVFIVWRKFAVYLLLFLLHNFLLAPLLLHRRRVLYFTIVAVVLAAFAVYQFNSRPDKRPVEDHRPEMGMRHHPAPPPDEMRDIDFHNRPELPPDQFAPNGKRPFFEERDIVAIVVLILMFGVNLGIKSYFRSRDDHKRLEELEKQHLEQQLEYLRYQINPHFFMNTLNNIHALIDIDPAKAQETVLELSRMMRFVLYEGDRHEVPLTKEMDFIRTYVKLMRLRYTDKVSISFQLPNEVPDKTIPPLILISFIENAFKHGISYQHDSFVEVNVSVEGESLHFLCRNSKAKVSSQELGEKKGGVGLANVRKRLDLLYGKSYTLDINDEPDTYNVQLIIPL